MKIFKRKPKVLTAEQAEEIRVQEFFDRISPSTVKFFADKFICGNSYKSVWAVREYPPSTEEQAKNLQVIQNAEIHGGIHFG